jgi:SAM-dependent methyltransferase
LNSCPPPDGEHLEREFYAEYREVEDRHWWFIGRRAILLALIAQNIPAPVAGTRRLLDIGCGTGTMLGHLARFGEVQGIDSDAEAVQYCKERGFKNVQQWAEPPFPFEDGSFDVVSALDVIEHADDDLGLLAEMRRLLRSGGLAVVTVPAYRFLWGPHDDINLHKRRYTAPELRRRLDSAGLKIVRLTYFNTMFFPAIAGLRLARKLRGGPPQPKSDFTLTKPGTANNILGRLFAVEAPVLKRVNLPFGVSILALAVKL